MVGGGEGVGVVEVAVAEVVEVGVMEEEGGVRRVVVVAVVGIFEVNEERR